MNILNIPKNIYYRFKYPELNDYTWMQTKLKIENKTEQDCADILGCDLSLIIKKRDEYGLNLNDRVFNVYTGRFHALAKHRGIVALAKPFIKNIEKTVDEIYNRTTSINSRIFKEIITDMEKVDRDVEDSSAKVLGYGRKAFYLLMMKFVICLYEFDTYYAERIDYCLMLLLEKKEEIYLSPITTNPAHHYPTRTQEALQQYFMGRVFGNNTNATIIRIENNKKESEQR